MRSGERVKIPLGVMSLPASFSIAREPLPDHEQKQAALSYLNEAWAEARHDGVDGDCLAQASMLRLRASHPAEPVNSGLLQTFLESHSEKRDFV